jgi:iron complex transport system ATP-binding protein
MIELQGVWFSYNGRSSSVLSDVSFILRSGAVTALLGPNGSGKTTLLNLLLGWLKPGEGEIRISGRTIGALSGRDRSRLIGHVAPDEPAVLELDVREYVFLGRTPYLGLSGRPEPDDLQAVESALNTVGLLSKAGRPVRTLSTGERQLAAVARALAQDPDLFLLDEPTSHLDLANTRRVLGLLDRLRSRGKTIVLTTHDPNTASVLADEVVILRAGRVLASGTPAAVMTDEILGVAYGVEVDVRLIDGRPHVLARL